MSKMKDLERSLNDVADQIERLCEVLEKLLEEIKEEMKCVSQIDNSEQWEDYMSTKEALRLAPLKIAAELERIADALEHANSMMS